MALAPKARAVSELVSPRPECDVFRARLKAPAIDQEAIAQTYAAARAAFCLKPTV